MKEAGRYFPPRGVLAAATLTLLSAVLLAGCGEGSQASTASFPADVYPPALPVQSGVNISGLSDGCPNPAGLTKTQELPVDAALDVLTGLISDDFDARRRATDAAFWPLLGAPDIRTEETTGESIAQDWIEVGRASDASHGELLANACGEETVDLSWWVKLCPGPCADPDVARSASLTGNVFLIQRQGYWLAWAVE